MSCEEIKLQDRDYDDNPKIKGKPNFATFET